MVVVLAAVAMAICGAVFRLLGGREGALPLGVSIVAVMVVIAALLGAIKRIIVPR